MQKPILSGRIYFFLFSLLSIVYIAGLFLPLMDNDAAHHANIALRMYLTGDYVTLMDHKGDYLDKPHFLFWTSALSYHLFGVTSFAYRLPSFLFTVLGTYSIFRLAKELYDKETGKLAALIAASSFCYILANSDVRMDALLTGAIVFASWQLVAFVHHRKFIFLVGTSLGLAVGFATKGHVGLVTPVAGIFFYILYKKQWQLLYAWQWLVVIFFFAFLISPVVYCYYLQFNLHPEKIIQGMKGVNGVKYILWGHSFERFSGQERFGAAGKKDYFFFLHAFLWTFAPWCIVACIAFYHRLKFFFRRTEEWLSTGVFLMLALLISFSSFKLPHYMTILAPFTSLMVAHFFVLKSKDARWYKPFYFIQIGASMLLLAASTLINAWAFPVNGIIVLAGLVLLLAVVFYFIRSRYYTLLQKAIAVSVASVVLFFFLLNTSFYPQLLTYQAGKLVADFVNKNLDARDVYFWKNTFSSSFNFYTATTRRVYHDSLNPNKKIYILYSSDQQLQLEAEGLRVNPLFRARDFEITMLTPVFLNPQSRTKVLQDLILAELVK